MPVRKLVLVVSAVARSLPLATGCSSGSRRQRGGSDRHHDLVQHGPAGHRRPFKAKLNPQAKAKGITVKWQKIDNINQIIMTKIQANDPPDIALCRSRAS